MSTTNRAVESDTVFKALYRNDKYQDHNRHYCLDSSDIYVCADIHALGHVPAVRADAARCPGARWT